MTRRQHPDNPNLLWCPVCKTYKVVEDFNLNARTKVQKFFPGRGAGHGRQWLCRSCQNEKHRVYRKKHHNEKMKYQREYRKTHPGKRVSEYSEDELQKKRAISLRSRHKRIAEDPMLAEQRKAQSRRCGKIRVGTCCDSYVVNLLKARGTKKITPELIELARQGVLAKRLLKQFIIWRKVSEPDNQDVHGKQRENEEDHGGRIQARGNMLGATGV